LVRSVGAIGFGATAAVVTRSPSFTLTAEIVFGLILNQQILAEAWKRSALSPGSIFRLAYRHLKKLNWTPALSLLAVTMISFTVLNADRWVATLSLKAPAFAEYAFAWTILLASQSSQAIINASVYPLLARRFGRFGRRAAYRVAAFASVCLLVIGAAVSTPAFWAVNEVIDRWYSSYQGARRLVPLFVIIALFRASDFWSSFLVITRHERRLLIVNCIAGTVSCAVWILWIFYEGHFRHLDTRDIAMLAVSLTVTTYFGNATSAWLVRYR
jgi:O-antigen/teichoic acid export membrane protein